MRTKRTKTLIEHDVTLCGKYEREDVFCICDVPDSREQLATRLVKHVAKLDRVAARNRARSSAFCRGIRSRLVIEL